jgi:hypothetical protein
VLFAAVVLVVASRARDQRGDLSPLRGAACGARWIRQPLALLRFKVGADVQNLAGLVRRAAMLVLFGLTWIFFVYRDDPYVDLGPQLVRLRAWGRA